MASPSDPCRGRDLLSRYISVVLLIDKLTDGSLELSKTQCGILAQVIPTLLIAIALERSIFKGDRPGQRWLVAFLSVTSVFFFACLYGAEHGLNLLWSGLILGYVGLEFLFVILSILIEPPGDIELVVKDVPDSREASGYL